MKSILLTSFLFLQVLFGYSQMQVNSTGAAPSNVNNSTTEAAKLTATPAYPGGNDAFAKFISKNIEYPRTARANKTQGKVIVRFKVGADGNVKEAKVPEGMGIGDGCDEEAIRVVMSSSKWTPGMRMGAPSAMWCEVPVVFALPEVK